MAMYATSANELKVDYGRDRFVTFKMHADLGIDLVRWLMNQTKEIEIVGKRAERIEKAAIDVADDDAERFNKLSQDAATLRDKGKNEIQMCVEYIKKASLGWTDFYEDEAAAQRQDLLPFSEENIARLGVLNLSKTVDAFNIHYGLIGEAAEAGESKGESLPEPSPSSIAEPNSQTSIVNTAQT